MRVEKLLKLWGDTLPELSMDEIKMLEEIERGGLSAYKIAKRTGWNISTVYRRCKKLERMGLVKRKESHLYITAYGCLILSHEGKGSLDRVLDCIKRSWGVEANKGEIIAFLKVLSQLICPHESYCINDPKIGALKILEKFKDVMELYLVNGLDFDEALRTVARELNVSAEELAKAIVFSLRTLSSVIPFTISTESHKVAVLIHNSFVMPIALNCKEECEYSREKLGLYCPKLEHEVKSKLRELIG
ncbi:hypothetical protein IPA_09120 [Ignicoccus pacificus DSM 13166]|uniref:Uncharacterized protein n=1 Tax=Ignicoccus pacificus DSM 13166 TaxID=940294 RepID=A0A977KCQ9_9CREN|nr:hypothetical protein IPA_09120 [Ignicoccus pacificus DSM 13166]